MGEPETIDTKFAHVHSERVWWLSVVVYSGYVQWRNVCVHLCVYICMCVSFTSIIMYICRCSLYVFSLYYFYFKGCISIDIVYIYGIS